MSATKCFQIKYLFVLGAAHWVLVGCSSTVQLNEFGENNGASSVSSVKATSVSCDMGTCVATFDDSNTTLCGQNDTEEIRVAYRAGLKVSQGTDNTVTKLKVRNDLNRTAVNLNGENTGGDLLMTLVQHTSDGAIEAVDRPLDAIYWVADYEAISTHELQAKDYGRIAQISFSNSDARFYVEGDLEFTRTCTTSQNNACPAGMKALYVSQVSNIFQTGVSVSDDGVLIGGVIGGYNVVSHNNHTPLCFANAPGEATAPLSQKNTYEYSLNHFQCPAGYLAYLEPSAQLYSSSSPNPATVTFFSVPTGGASPSEVTHYTLGPNRYFGSRLDGDYFVNAKLALFQSGIDKVIVTLDSDDTAAQFLVQIDYGCVAANAVDYP